jgi:hypothetical protein
MNCLSEMETDDEFFGFTRVQSSSNAGIQQEFDVFLGDESKSVDSLKKFPTVKQAFIRYNTGTPYSVTVERLFSAGGQILTPRRSRLSDDHFEMLLLLRANKDFC